MGCIYRMDGKGLSNPMFKSSHGVPMIQGGALRHRGASETIRIFAMNI